MVDAKAKGKQPMMALSGDVGGRASVDRRLPYRLDFGKNRGKTLRECPHHYLQFLTDNRTRFDSTRYPGLHRALAGLMRGTPSTTPSRGSQRDASRGPLDAGLLNAASLNTEPPARRRPVAPMTPRPLPTPRPSLTPRPLTPRPPPPRHIPQRPATPPPSPHATPPQSPPPQQHTTLPPPQQPTTSPPPQQPTTSPPASGGGWFPWRAKRPAPNAAPDRPPQVKRRCVSASPEPRDHNTLVRIDIARDHARLEALVERNRHDARQAITRAANHHDDQFRDGVWDLGVLVKHMARKSTDETLAQLRDLLNGPLAKMAQIQHTVEQAEARDMTRHAQLDVERQALQVRVHQLKGAIQAAVGDADADADALQHHVNDLRARIQESTDARQAAESNATRLQAALDARQAASDTARLQAASDTARLQAASDTARLQAALDASQAAEAGATPDVQVLQTDIRELKSATQAAAQRLATQLEQLKADSDNELRLRHQMRELETANVANTQVIHARDKVVHELQTQLDKVKAEAGDCKSKFDNQVNRMHELQHGLDKSKREVQALQGQCKEALHVQRDTAELKHSVDDMIDQHHRELVNVQHEQAMISHQESESSLREQLSASSLRKQQLQSELEHYEDLVKIQTDTIEQALNTSQLTIPGLQDDAGGHGSQGSGRGGDNAWRTAASESGSPGDYVDEGSPSGADLRALIRRIYLDGTIPVLEWDTDMD
ncbi:hypothetical protein HBI42_219090 [Parastagonospora nodorum]|nr:hypothetical protein HBI47_219340 [Parastagonospora nodorum]KAH6201710.1 hypothetical protein HBI43_216640 [Parastagonospora nodorum]KAH6243402.1 hypothetical protein HBI42_219090 [Parastagonospora nodorum]